MYSIAHKSHVSAEMALFAAEEHIQRCSSHSSILSRYDVASSESSQTLLQFIDVVHIRLVATLHVSQSGSTPNCWQSCLWSQNERKCLPFQKFYCIARSVCWCFIFPDDNETHQRFLVARYSSICAIGSVALLVARRTNDRKFAGSRHTKVVCITVLTGNRMGVNCPLWPAATSSSEL